TDATIPTNNIADPENFPITAGSNDVIYVRIEHPTNGCFIISEIHLSTTVRPVVNLVDDVAVCVDETTGDYLFDLTIFDDQIVTNPLDYNITYHESQADADSGDNPITPENAYPVAINSTPVTVYIRVEADGCPNVGTVEIVVNSNPVLNENLEIETICDEDGDGEIIVDLTENESYFMGTDPGPFEISYHTDQLEAETGTNPILNSTNYTIVAGATEVIYIRVKYQQNTCYSIRTITYTTVERPVLNELDDVTECVDQTDGTIPYDLSVFDSQIIADPQNYDISYYLTLEDAQLSQNPITNYQNYPVPVNVSTEIFIRVEAGGCADFRSVIITFNSNPVVNDLDNQAFCSTEVSGTIPYDLTQHQPEWVNDDPANYIFSYHTSQSDADLDQNPILNSGNYPVTVGITTEIYVRIENPVTGCYTTTILTLYPGTTATLLDNLELALCDDNFDEVFIYDLTELNEQLITNSNNYDFDYYTSLSEAQDNTNPIPQTQWNAYNINSLPFEIWVVATT